MTLAISRERQVAIAMAVIAKTLAYVDKNPVPEPSALWAHVPFGEVPPYYAALHKLWQNEVPSYAELAPEIRAALEATTIGGIIGAELDDILAGVLPPRYRPSSLPFQTPLTGIPTDYQPNPATWEFTGKTISLSPELNTLSLGDPSGYEPLEITLFLDKLSEAERLEVEETFRLTLCRILDAHNAIQAPPPTDTTALIFEAIRKERQRQEEKWGEQNHDLPIWMLILGEEVGEACQAVLKLRAGDPDQLRAFEEEVVQCAAVSIQILEYLRREK